MKSCHVLSCILSPSELQADWLESCIIQYWLDQSQTMLELFRIRVKLFQGAFNDMNMFLWHYCKNYEQNFSLILCMPVTYGLYCLHSHIFECQRLVCTSKNKWSCSKMFTHKIKTGQKRGAKHLSLTQAGQLCHQNRLKVLEGGCRSKRPFFLNGFTISKINLICRPETWMKPHSITQTNSSGLIQDSSM